MVVKAGASEVLVEDAGADCSEIAGPEETDGGTHGSVVREPTSRGMRLCGRR